MMKRIQFSNYRTPPVKDLSGALFNYPKGGTSNLPSDTNERICNRRDNTMSWSKDILIKASAESLSLCLLFRRCSINGWIIRVTPVLGEQN